MARKKSSESRINAFAALVEWERLKELTAKAGYSLRATKAGFVFAGSKGKELFKTKNIFDLRDYVRAHISKKGRADDQT